MGFKVFLAAIFWLIALSALALASSETAIITTAETPITFDAANLFPDLALTSASWGFADDTTENGLAVSHSFTLPGVYNVQMNATDSQGVLHFGFTNVIVNGSVPFVSDSAKDAALYFFNLPQGIFYLTIEQLGSVSVDIAGFDSGGKFFNITSDLPNGDFSAQMIFSYNDSDDNGIIDGTSVNENLIEAYFYSDGSWVKVPSAELNTNSNTITATVSHFTFFGLLAPQTPSGPVTPPNSGGSSGGGSGGGGGGGGGGALKKKADSPINQSSNTTTDNLTQATHTNASTVANESSPKDESARNAGESPELSGAAKEAKSGLLRVLIILALAAVSGWAFFALKKARKKPN